MSMESALQALLLAKCPRTFPDVAPSGTARPFVTWQGLGGESLGFLDNTAASHRHTLMQVSCYATTRFAALLLIRDIEAAIRATTAFIGTPQGEPISVYEDDVQLYGCVQRFEIYATR
jgi:hypothetical protein